MFIPYLSENTLRFCRGDEPNLEILPAGPHTPWEGMGFISSLRSRLTFGIGFSIAMALFLTLFLIAPAVYAAGTISLPSPALDKIAGPLTPLGVPADSYVSGYDTLSLRTNPLSFSHQFLI